MRTHDAGDTQFFDPCYPLLLGFLPQAVPTPVSMQEGVCVCVRVYRLNRCKTFTGVYIAYDRFSCFLENCGTRMSHFFTVPVHCDSP